MTESTQTEFRSCNLCEAICGLSIEHDGSKAISIKGDKDDPLSRGHICPKAIALQDIHTDPDRLRTPVLRTENGFEPIGWDDAFDLIEEKIGGIRKEYGDDAVAFYLGNPTVHNSGALLFQTYLKRSLRTRNQFAATSVDQLPHHLAASLMFGHGLLIPFPDIDNTEFMLILGANPAASNGSLMTAPDVKNRLKAIVKQGGKVVLVDPRKTETAKLTTSHHFIRPGTDVYLLAGILNVLFERKLVQLERLGSFTKNVSALQAAIQEFSPEVVSRITGIEQEDIVAIATEFASAKRAVVYGRMGVSTQEHGGLCHWLINAINLVTGNLDRVGGQMFSNPAVPLVRKQGTAKDFNRWQSRVRGLPEFEGDLPVAVLAEEILTPGKGRIRALITNAGNPVLSTPNGRKLEEAIEGLDFYVALDIYVNETTKHADLILPSPSGLETEHYDLIFNTLAVRNVAKYSPRLFEPAAGSKYDWQIMKELSLRLMPAGEGLFGTIKRWFQMRLLKWLTPNRILDIGLKLGPYGLFRQWLSLKKLKRNPHGVDLGALTSMLPKMLRTDDRKIDAAPPLYTRHLAKLASQLSSVASVLSADNTDQNPNQFQLIGRRHLRSNNSWMHNSPRLVKGNNRCTLMMCSVDAERLSMSTGQNVTVLSDVGSVVVPLEVTEEIMPGVVSLPHGYGHHRTGTKLGVAEKHAGVSINDLTSDAIVDPVSGNAAFSGQIVTVISGSKVAP